jgi:hypothetical protein
MHIFVDTKLTNVQENGLSYFFDPLPSWAEVGKCYGFPCTGPDNALVYDKDGGLLSNSLGGFILPHNGGVAHKDCVYNSKNQSYTCTNTSDTTYKYAMLSFESLDIDSEDRTIAPVEITSEGI